MAESCTCCGQLTADCALASYDAGLTDEVPADVPAFWWEHARSGRPAGELSAAVLAVLDALPEDVTESDRCQRCGQWTWDAERGACVLGCTGGAAYA